MIRRLSIIAMLIFSTVGVQAQITLNDYVDSVIEYSYTLLSAEAMVDSRVAESKIAKRNMLPSLSLSSDADYSFGSDDIGWGVRAEIAQPIYDGGRYRSLSEQSRYQLIESIGLRDKSEMDVRYNAEIAYWTLSRAEIYREAMHDYINIIKTLRDVALHRFEEGYTSKSDLLQIESRLSDAEYQLSQAEQRWSVALHNFNLLRGVDPLEVVKLGWSILDDYALPTRVKVDDFIEHHPDYVVAIAERESAKCNISLRDANYLPHLNLGVYGLWQPKIDAGTMLNGGVMLSLSTPIFHFGERREALRSARSGYRSAELMVDNIVDDITLNESNGWTNLESSYQRIGAARRSLEIAKENLDISTYSYREGLVTILDVLQAQLSWLQIYQNAITAQYDYAVAISSYRYIIAEG